MTRKGKKNSFRTVVTCVLILILHVSRTHGQSYLAGVRAGTSFESDAGDFQQVDFFAAKYLPFQLGFNNGPNLKPRWEASAGVLNNRGYDGFVGTTGPVLELRVGKFPVTLEGGISLTGLSRYNFPDRNLGGRFEFTDHVGLNWRVTKRFTLGWRFQHSSNAGIYSRDPGLNLQMLSGSFSF